MISDQKNFSVLMAVYQMDLPNQLDESIKSIIKQTLPPTEVVLVKDGPVGKELDAVIEKWASDYPRLFQIVSLKENQGLGRALDLGIRKCSCGIVARMDADDISCPDRFEKQFDFLRQNPDISLVSSWMACFDGHPDDILFIRRAPASHEKIVKVARFRNPINHAPSMFRRNAVLEAGGYRDWPGFEDYHLFVQMITRGAKMACLPETLYKVRVQDLCRRRRGLKRINVIINLQKEFLEMKFISFWQFLFNIATRTITCVLPVSFVRFMRTKIIKL